MSVDAGPIADFCRTLPGTTADMKWGEHLVFSIGGKMYCIIPMDEEVPERINFKVEEHRFLEMTDREGVIPAPYMARAKWVKLMDPTAIDGDELEELVRTSYELVFAKLTKKLQRELRPTD